MLVIPIKFQFSIESEVNRVKETIGNIEWLISNSYRFILPNSVKDSGDIKIEKIKELVENEYDSEIYQIAESAILKSWKGNNELIRRINQKMNGSYMLNEINIILTKYGTQGSYVMPNSAIINISNIPPEFLIKTVIHESLHLMIEHLIKKYLVEHWVKEHIVDLIMDLEYKSRFKMQPVPDWVLAVDVIFKEYYPNITFVIEKSAKIFSNKNIVAY